MLLEALIGLAVVTGIPFTIWGFRLEHRVYAASPEAHAALCFNKGGANVLWAFRRARSLSRSPAVLALPPALRRAVGWHVAGEAAYLWLFVAVTVLLLVRHQAQAVA